MYRNYVIRPFHGPDDAQPWDTYVIGTTTSSTGDQGTNTKGK
jgi:hypothetical protein